MPITRDAGLAEITAQFDKIGFKQVLSDQVEKRSGTPAEDDTLAAIMHHVTGSNSNYSCSKDMRGEPLVFEMFEDKVPEYDAINRVYNYFNLDICESSQKELAKGLKRRKLIKGKLIATDASYIEITRTEGYENWSEVKVNDEWHRGYKVVVAYDVETNMPLLFLLYPANVHEVNALVPLAKKVKALVGRFILLVDRGFYDAPRFSKLDRMGITLITPCKSTLTVKYGRRRRQFKKVLEEAEFMARKLDGNTLIYDQKTTLTDFPKTVRLVIVYCGNDAYGLICTNKHFRADRIVSLYTLRWRIEEFFDEAKNDLGLERLPKRSFDGIRAHVLICFIAYTLLNSLRVKCGLVGMRIRFVIWFQVKIPAVVEYDGGLILTVSKLPLWWKPPD